MAHLMLFLISGSQGARQETVRSGYEKPSKYHIAAPLHWNSFSRIMRVVDHYDILHSRRWPATRLQSRQQGHR